MPQAISCHGGPINKAQRPSLDLAFQHWVSEVTPSECGGFLYSTQLIAIDEPVHLWLPDAAVFKQHKIVQGMFMCY